jgi:hypothetical protein
MSKFLLFLSATLSTLLLTGCSIFYPNWGATGLPEGDPSALTQSVQTASASQEPAETSQLEPEPTESETTAAKLVAEVVILMAVAEPDYGVLTIVAKVPNLSEIGGTCTMRFLLNNVEKKLQVKAEPSSDYTQCFPIEFPLAELPRGNGVVTVTYESERYSGVSAATSVVIP